MESMEDLVKKVNSGEKKPSVDKGETLKWLVDKTEEWVRISRANCKKEQS